MTDALSSRSLLAIEAVERYCEIVAWAAADMAVSATAVGGVYLAGPTADRLRYFFAQTRFRPLFEQRHTALSAFALHAIPTFVVTSKPVRRGT